MGPAVRVELPAALRPEAGPAAGGRGAGDRRGRVIAHRPYRDLSEGQKQRALLARVLATEADFVLLDEPTAAMDAVAERETMQRLAELTRGPRRLAVVVVSHDMHVAAEFADQLLFVDREAPRLRAGRRRTPCSATPPSATSTATITALLTLAAIPSQEIRLDPQLAETSNWAQFWGAYELFSDPMLCALIAGGVLGFLSVYVVLRRMVFVSAAVTQSAGLGVALAFFAEIHLGVHVEPTAGRDRRCRCWPRCC